MLWAIYVYDLSYYVMPIIEGRTTYDCAPTLDDDQVMAFCKEGYLALRGVVPEEVNARCMAFLHEHSIADHSEADARARTTWGRGPEMVSPRAAEPVELFAQEWFVDGVFLCPAVVGAVRTLLGPDFGLPVLLSNHRADDAAAESRLFRYGRYHDAGSRAVVASRWRGSV